MNLDRRHWLRCGAAVAMLAGTGVGGAVRASAQAAADAVAQARPPAGPRNAAPPGITAFSALPEGRAPGPDWAEQRVAGIAPNRASIVRLDGWGVLQIESSASASAWTHPVVGGDRLREIAWRWRADGFPRSSRPGEREADDFAARVYLLFDYPLERVPFAQRLGLRIARSVRGDDLPAASICYLLHEGENGGEPLDSPYTSRVRMLVARPRARAGVWYSERRDIRADFARCFGDEYGAGMPPVSAVVVGADSDQGGGGFSSYFGDIALR
jgi:hypothetical protein